MHDKVTRLRQIIAEAVPREPVRSPQEIEARHACAFYELNAPAPIVVEQTHRARVTREIMRIADWYGWRTEIERALDLAGSHTLTTLEDYELEDLLSRLKNLEECSQQGIGAPDAPPAT